jgi:hypothetical protein
MQFFVDNYQAIILWPAIRVAVMEHSLLVRSPYIRKPTALIHFERELSVVAQKVMTLNCRALPESNEERSGFLPD